MHEAADIHDPRMVAALEQRQQMARKGEVAKVVGSELDLEIIGRGLTRERRNDTGIVDKEVEGGMRTGKATGELGDVGEIRKVELLERDHGGRIKRSDLADRFLSFARVAAG